MLVFHLNSSVTWKREECFVCVPLCGCLRERESGRKKRVSGRKKRVRRLVLQVDCSHLTSILLMPFLVHCSVPWFISHYCPSWSNFAISNKVCDMRTATHPHNYATYKCSPVLSCAQKNNVPHSISCICNTIWVIASKTVGNKTADKCEVFKKCYSPLFWNEFIDYPSACAWN